MVEADIKTWLSCTGGHRQGLPWMTWGSTNTAICPYLTQILDVFPDYCFLSIYYTSLNFRILFLKILNDIFQSS